MNANMHGFVNVNTLNRVYLSHVSTVSDMSSHYMKKLELHSFFVFSGYV